MGGAGCVPTCAAMQDLIAYLVGTWRIERVVADRRADAKHSMAGTAWYMRARDGLHYAERVRWTAPDGQLLDGHRRYWLVATGPWAAEVRFEDGRLFHPLDLRTGRAAVQHTCAPDHYAGWYALDGRDRHRTGWTVTGPRKDLVIATTYTRSPAAATDRTTFSLSLERF